MKESIETVEVDERNMCSLSLEKRGDIYVLTLSGQEQDHRLTATLFDSIRSALARVRSDQTAKALITTAQGKFFSNGVDFSGSLDHRFRLLISRLRYLLADVITLPMPTVAAVTGHASAGGFLFALSHDYIVMRNDRGFLYMSEMDLGLKIPAGFLTLLRCKIGEPHALRDVVLKAAKLTAMEAKKKGIVDVVCGDAEATVGEAFRMAEELAAKGWNGKVYAENRIELMREVLEQLMVDEGESNVKNFLSKI